MHTYNLVILDIIKTMYRAFNFTEDLMANESLESTMDTSTLYKRLYLLEPL